MTPHTPHLPSQSAASKRNSTKTRTKHALPPMIVLLPFLACVQALPQQVPYLASSSFTPSPKINLIQIITCSVVPIQYQLHFATNLYLLATILLLGSRPGVLRASWQSAWPATRPLLAFRHQLNLAIEPLIQKQEYSNSEQARVCSRYLRENSYRWRVLLTPNTLS